MLFRVPSVIFAIGLAALTGCGPGKLDISTNFTLDGEPKLFFLDPQSKPQKITVEYESSAGEITVLLMKSADVPKGEEGFVPTGKAIAFKKDKSGTFSGELPEKTEGQVIVRGGIKTDVKIKIHNH